MSAPKKKASGRNVTDAERNTDRITLRLDPEAMDLLKHFAAAWKCPMSEVVSAALDSLNEDKGMLETMKMVTTARDAADDRSDPP